MLLFDFIMRNEKLLAHFCVDSYAMKGVTPLHLFIGLVHKLSHLCLRRVIFVEFCLKGLRLRIFSVTPDKEGVVVVSLTN
jgi:hypothetical protein